jgi:hypothetical protein
VNPGSSRGSAGLSPFVLCRLLIGLRLRLWRNRLRGGPNRSTARLAALMGVLVPVAYLGLFANAFQSLARAGGGGEGGALALVCTAIALASGAFKIAGREAVTGGGGESELLLARPVALPALVLARSLAGVVTDLYDALFLLPVLGAAALVWGLGAPALLLAALCSALVQVAVSAGAQAVQILVVRLVPVRGRRLVWTACALAAAAAMAALWMAGSGVLRDPAGTARALIEHQPWLEWLPGAWIAAPLQALRQGGAVEAAGPLAALLAMSAGTLALAWWLASLCARRGWEPAGPPWQAGARAGAGGRRSGLSLFQKDWRVFTRDRTRLVIFLAMPVLFVGMQVFGSAGWRWLSQDAVRLALLAYSLAAYAATFGPLQHMGAEGRAFWILHAAPVPIGRLLAAKAAFWTCLVAALAAAVYLLLIALSGVGFGWQTTGLLALVVAGAATVAFLAVGLATEVADLSDERRPAVGIGTTYLFMLVAGLFNAALLQPGPDRLRALLLYLLAAGAAWSAGVSRARVVFDAEATARPSLSPTIGALGAVLLFLGERATRVAAAALDTDAGGWVQLPFVAAIGAGLLAHRWRNRRAATGTGGAGRAAAAATALGALGALLLRALGPALLAPAPVAVQLTRALVEEVTLRGLFQVGLAPLGSALPRRLGAAAASALAAWSVSPQPFTGLGVLGALLPAVTMGATGRLWAALITRALLEGATVWLVSRPPGLI